VSHLSLSLKKSKLIFLTWKLAKRKADELEDFGSSDIQLSEPETSPEVTGEGIQIVEELLKTWASNADGDDIIMSDDLSPAAQLQRLKNCVEAFRPRIENNAWLQSMLKSL
jgi:DNA mismatch repair protein MSH2